MIRIFIDSGIKARFYIWKFCSLTIFLQSSFTDMPATIQEVPKASPNLDEKPQQQ